MEIAAKRSKRQLKPVAMRSNYRLAVPAPWRVAIQQYETVLLAAGRSDGTRYLRTYQIRRFAADHPRTDPWQVVEEQIIAWMARHQWAPDTRCTYRASLRAFYSWAHARGFVAIDPSYSIPGIAVPPPVPRPAPDDVVDVGLRTVELRVRMAIMILTFTGMRRHEVAKLHTDDLEWVGDGWAVRVCGKGGRVRLIPVDDAFAAVIRALPPGFVFPGQIDGHLSAAHLGKLVSHALPGRWTAHTLRHRFASLAYSIEKDIRAVQELLGHAKITTTQIYTFVPRASVRKAAGGARLGLHAA